MASYFSLFERMILESLSAGAKDFLTLEKDLQFDNKLLNHCLRYLVDQGILNKIQSNYEIDQFEKINQNTNIKYEISGLAELVLEQAIHKTPGFQYKLKKVFMNAREKKIFQAHLKSLDDFLGGLSKGPSVNIYEKEVIFWGQANYGDCAKCLASEIALN